MTKIAVYAQGVVPLVHYRAKLLGRQVAQHLDIVVFSRDGPTLASLCRRGLALTGGSCAPDRYQRQQGGSGDRSGQDAASRNRRMHRVVLSREHVFATQQQGFAAALFVPFLSVRLL
jgi:hypothetical protein